MRPPPCSSVLVSRWPAPSSIITSGTRSCAASSHRRVALGHRSPCPIEPPSTLKSSAPASAGRPSMRAHARHQRVGGDVRAARPARRSRRSCPDRTGARCAGARRACRARAASRSTRSGPPMRACAASGATRARRAAASSRPVRRRRRSPGSPRPILSQRSLPGLDCVDHWRGRHAALHLSRRAGARPALRAPALPQRAAALAARRRRHRRARARDRSRRSCASASRARRSSRSTTSSDPASRS